MADKKRKLGTKSKKTSPKKISKKTPKKVAKKAAKKSAKKIAKKPAKKAARKSAKKIAKKPTKKLTKKTTKKAKKKSAKAVKTGANKKRPVASKKIAKKVAKKVAKGAKKTTAAKKVATPAPPKKLSRLGAKAESWDRVFTPLDDRLLIEEIEAVQESPSGLWLPSSPRDYLEGHVRAMGPGAKDHKGRRKPPGLSLGERVLISKYAGQRLRLLDRDFLIVRESDLIGIVEESKN